MRLQSVFHPKFESWPLPNVEHTTASCELHSRDWHKKRRREGKKAHPPHHPGVGWTGLVGASLGVLELALSMFYLLAVTLVYKVKHPWNHGYFWQYVLMLISKCRTNVVNVDKLLHQLLKGRHGHPNFVSLSVPLPDDHSSIIIFKVDVVILQNPTNDELPYFPHSDLHNIFYFNQKGKLLLSVYYRKASLFVNSILVLLPWVPGVVKLWSSRNGDLDRCKVGNWPLHLNSPPIKGSQGWMIFDRNFMMCFKWLFRQLWLLALCLCNSKLMLLLCVSTMTDAQVEISVGGATKKMLSVRKLDEILRGLWKCGLASSTIMRMQNAPLPTHSIPLHSYCGHWQQGRWDKSVEIE